MGGNLKNLEENGLTKIPRNDFVLQIVLACLAARDTFGKFSQRDVVAKLPDEKYKGKRFYVLFKELIENGDIVEQKFRFYTLNEAIIKAEKVSKPIDRVYPKTVEEIAQIAIDRVNLLMGAKYKLSKKTLSQVSARVAEGFTSDDFITVIEKKHRDWKNSKMEIYIRPETLFGTKFQGYLNQTKPMSKIEEMQNIDFDKFFK